MGFLDPQCPFQIVTPLGSVAKLTRSNAQGIECCGQVFMVWATLGFLDPQYPFEVVTSLGIIA
eukprot:1966946-Amphidinium_carterae.1